MPGDSPMIENPGHSTPPPARHRRRRWGPWLLLILLALGGAGGWYWWTQMRQPAATEATQGRRGAGQGRPPIPVAAVPATPRDIPIRLAALGTVQALNSVTLRAQVEGVLLEVAVTEGQEVEAGTVVARIDPRPYAAALAQAEAKRAQDQALLANARVDLQRYTELARAAGASRQQLDTQRALVQQYEALIQADEAAIASARTQLDFTTIRAPVTGRVGLRQVDPGNVVRSSDANGIMVVNQLRPITVSFTLPQQQLRQVLTAMGEGPVAVQVVGRDGQTQAEGTLLTPDNQVDTTTGTVRFKATFPNDNGLLWPGAFVNVRLTVGTLRQVLTIPVEAVQRGPQGAFTFVLQQDSTVSQRPLTLGLVAERLAVVQQGLQPGEQVITSGALRLDDGARVVMMQPQGGGQEAPAGGGQRWRRPGGGQPGAAQPGAAQPAAAQPGPGQEQPQAPPQGLRQDRRQAPAQ
jgi:multidrug efflux system membrane fusion protein